MLIPAAEFASLAQQTASLALPTLSAMLAMLDMILRMESASLQLSTAQVDNSDTMEFATLPALSVAALKETSARESAPLAHGHTTTDATEIAQPSTPPMMLALTLAQLELPFKMEFAKLALKAAHQANSSIAPHHRARPVNILALNAHSLPHTAQLA